MKSSLSNYYERMGVAVWFILVVWSGVVTVIYEQAPAPDYWMVLGVAATYLSIHALFAIPYIIRIRTWSRWVAFGLFTAASVSYLAMTVRIWL